MHQQLHYSVVSSAISKWLFEHRYRERSIGRNLLRRTIGVREREVFETGPLLLVQLNAISDYVNPCIKFYVTQSTLGSQINAL